MNKEDPELVEDEESSIEAQAWIQWFCDLEGHEFFAEIDDDYIRDHFNLYGLKTQFTRFSDALRMILREEAPDAEEFNKEEFIEIYQQAIDLYGLIHARFILTQRGATLMKEKYWQGEFGCCPRVLWKRQYVLPIATTETLNTSRVKVFWPRWQDIYVPRNGTVDLDGAYFGWYFPQSFMQFFPELFENNGGPEKYISKLYGFRVLGSKGSRFPYEFDSNGNVTNKKLIDEVKNTVILDNEHNTRLIDANMRIDSQKSVKKSSKKQKKIATPSYTDLNNPEIENTKYDIKSS